MQRIEKDLKETINPEPKENQELNTGELEPEKLNENLENSSSNEPEVEPEETLETEKILVWLKLKTGNFRES